MTRPTGQWARFDDMIAGVATMFTNITAELVARHPDEVVDVLDEVDRVTAAGAWAVGFVAYEAAPGLDPTLTTRQPSPGAPLAWFGTYAAPQAVPLIDAPTVARVPVADWTPRWSEDRYRASVAAIRQRIAAGDTYQCNLTTQLTTRQAQDPFALYQQLTHAQRGAHHAYLDIGDLVIASASPELFFQWSGDEILMRPMKGTAPRGRTTAEDAAAPRTS